MKQANSYLRELYLDYFNNYLTVALFAEHNELTTDQAKQLLDIGVALQEDYAQRCKGQKVY